MRKMTLILTQSEKGGAGKTTVADAIVAGLMASAANVFVGDADDGVSGYINVTGKGNAEPMSWMMGADAVPRWFQTHFANRDAIVIDCGANIITSGAPINQFLAETVCHVGASGGRVIALAIASTNAPGTERLPKDMRDCYGEHADVRLVRNNQDGSWTFPKSLATIGMKKADLGHIEPGIRAARLLKKQPLLDVLSSPDVGYASAMGCYAETVARFIAEPDIADIFANDAADRIRSLAQVTPRSLKYDVRRLLEASDTALKANNKLWLLEHALGIARNCDDDGLLHDVAEAVFEADQNYLYLFSPSYS